MATQTFTGTVTDQSSPAQVLPISIVIGVADPLTILGVSITPQNAVAGTMRHIVVSATGGVAPLTYTLNGITNSTGIFDFVV